MSRKYHQGRFKPKNPQKYNGDPTGIIYRSGWELRLMSYLDDHPHVKKWASEELVIPYVSPIDGRYHRYFTDFVVWKSDGEVLVVEVKPANQTKPPVLKEGRSKKNYINEVRTFGINKAKWDAADKFCKKKGWKFVIFTEHDLPGKK